MNTITVSGEQGFNTKTVLDNTTSLNYQIGMSDTLDSTRPEKPNYLAAHREAAGLADHELAEKIGTSQPQINRLENGKRKLTIDWLKKIGDALGKPVEDLLKPPRGGTDKEDTRSYTERLAVSDSKHIGSSPNAGLANEPLQVNRRRIDVLGRAAGGREGKFILNGDRIDQIFCPPSVEAASNPYAVYIFGTSMEPRYEDGEMAIANPDAPYRKGNYVVVQLLTGDDGIFECYVKRFVSFGKDLVLEQLNPPKDHDTIMRFPAARVHAIHKLVGPDGK